MKLPYMPWYIGDWRKDSGVQALPYHDRGIWFEILCHMYESTERGKLLLNGRPMPDDALARLLGLDRQVLASAVDKLLSYGVASRCEKTGALMSRRMVRDEEIRRKRASGGILGGNPALVGKKDNHPPNHPPDNESEVESASDSAKGSLRGFDEFWQLYPKKKAKGAAERAFSRIKAEERELILPALEKQRKWASWLKDGGQFIPYPATWLNAKGWLDCEGADAMQKAETLTDKWRKYNQETGEGLTFNQYREKFKV